MRAAAAVRGVPPRRSRIAAPSAVSVAAGGERRLRIYTRTGDLGETSLLGGARVGKQDLRVEAYGAVDELNAALGWARALGAGAAVDGLLRTVQSDLFHMGADLARPGTATGPAAPRLGPERTAALERAIDDWDGRLEPLRHFILPGGCPAGAALHVARTVARRAERRVVALARREEVNPHVLTYLNRLSDLLFVAARHVNREAGSPEVPWEPR